ncbi:uncharacterized protein IUM83_15260 [Phytophthora cinnamomi]|uniref:uncharacterized protein n=1 Tax=Phytophthora cinnamomi TaxID=4785 RepID=UPI0035593DF9|nr:hypothetical protein IUM83_15260 [Phytophthora cinnamomi]
MTQAILKIDERISSRQSSLSHSRARDASRQRDDRRRDDSRRHERSKDTRRRDDRRRDDLRDAYNRRDRRERGYERRLYDSRNMPRVSLAEASVADIIAELHERDTRDTRSELQQQRHRYDGDSNSEDGSEHGSDDSQRCGEDWGDNYSSDGSDDAQCSGEDWGDSYSSDGSDDYLAAANDKGQRVAAEGTCAWSDNRQLRSDPAGRSQGRDNRLQSRGYRDEKSRQYGPCAACGGLHHLAHYCRHRCQLCMQVHDVDTCEVFQQLTTIVKSKVDKKDLTPELQELLFSDHLN